MQAGRDLRSPGRFELSNGADLIEPQPPRSPDLRSYAATAFGHMAVLLRNRKVRFVAVKVGPIDGMRVLHSSGIEL
jgi:hypothetical protein